MELTEHLLQLVFSGLTMGGVYALIALGFNLVYRTTDAINFAQGEFVMLGGVLAAVLYRDTGWPLWVVGPLAILTATAVGLLTTRTVIYPLHNPSVLTVIILTIGLAIALKSGVMLTVGKSPFSLPAFSGEEPFVILGATFVPQGLWILGTTLGVMLAMYGLFERTLTGKAMLATAVDRDASALVGVNVKAMVLWSFALSAAAGALAGVLVTPITLTSYNAGTILGLKGFAAAVIGGLGHVYGAVFGGLLLGLLESFGAGLFLSGYRDAIAFFVLLVLLFVRPSGLMWARPAVKT